MTFYSVKLRVKELASALSKEVNEVIQTCLLLGINAKTGLTTLSIEECKVVTDYYEGKEEQSIPAK